MICIDTSGTQAMAVLRCRVGWFNIEVSLASLSFVNINSPALVGYSSEIRGRRFIHISYGYCLEISRSSASLRACVNLNTEFKISPSLYSAIDT